MNVRRVPFKGIVERGIKSGLSLVQILKFLKVLDIEHYLDWISDCHFTGSSDTLYNSLFTHYLIPQDALHWRYNHHSQSKEGDSPQWSYSGPRQFDC